MATETDAEIVVLGVVTGAHGIGGEIRVFPYNPDSEHFEPARSVQLRGPDGKIVEHQIVRCRRHKKYVLLKVEGIDNRSAAELARGLEVVLSREELLPPGEDEYYYHDLLGLDVQAEDGRSLGTIRDIFETAAHAVLVVGRGDGHRDRLIPCTEASVIQVALDEGRIVVSTEAAVLDGT